MTCKQRKLRYIREKNSLVIGKGVFNNTYKISNEVLNDEHLSFSVLNQMMVNSKKELFMKYKIHLNTISYSITCNGDDFIKNIKTVLVTINK